MHPQEQLAIIKKQTVDLLPEDELVAKLSQTTSNGRLRVKLGLDPSRPDIHIGHAVVLNKLRQFQDLGHTVILIIGDFTAMIGDPTGKSKTRPALTLEETRHNGRTYVDQAMKVLDSERLEVVYNSAWLGAMTFGEVVSLAAKYTVAQLLERDDFTKRYKGGEPISVHEFLYPLSQAYDSVAIKSDIELGGTDQKFNLLVGREVMKAYGQSPQCILTLPILEGTDGVEKMSKSLGNYVGLTDSPRDMFGKTMSIPDSLITRWLDLAAFAEPSEVATAATGLADGTLHPRAVKVDLAKRIVTRYHSSNAADEAFAEFERVFVKKDVPDEMPEFSINNALGTSPSIVAVMTATKLVSSNSEARRLITQGGVQLDGVKVNDINMTITIQNPTVLRVGKLKFVRLLPDL